MPTTDISRAQAQAHLDSFGSARVVVLGDVMLDRYFWGQVDRISPEAPVPIVRVTRRSARLGGAANVAANLRSLGVDVALAGIVGDDRSGSELRALLEKREISTAEVHTLPNGETTEKVRIIAQHQQVVRADFEPELESVDGETDGLLDRVAALCEKYDALVVSDYGKGVIREDRIKQVIAAWRARKRPVLIDPHVGHFRWYRGATIVTPNTKEALSYFSSTIRREELFAELGFRMREELSLEGLLITQGEEGMTLFLKDDEKTQIQTVAKDVYDVTGAGDTVISVLAAGLACGASLLEGVIMANRAAGEVVKEVGTTVITRDGFLRAFV